MYARSIGFLLGFLSGASVVGIAAITSKRFHTPTKLQWFINKDGKWTLHPYSDLISIVYTDHCLAQNINISSDYEVYDALVTFNHIDDSAIIRENNDTIYDLKRF